MFARVLKTPRDRFVFDVRPPALLKEETEQIFEWQHSFGSDNVVPKVEDLEEGVSEASFSMFYDEPMRLISLLPKSVKIIEFPIMAINTSSLSASFQLFNSIIKANNIKLLCADKSLSEFVANVSDMGCEILVLMKMTDEYKDHVAMSCKILMDNSNLPYKSRLYHNMSSWTNSLAGDFDVYQIRLSVPSFDYDLDEIFNFQEDDAVQGLPTEIDVAKETANAESVEKDAGSVDEDSADDAGSLDEGSLDEDSADDAGSADERSLDEGSLDEGSLDEGSLDEGSLDEGSLDEGSLDEGSLDEGSLDTQEKGGLSGFIDSIAYAAERLNPAQDQDEGTVVGAQDTNEDEGGPESAGQPECPDSAESDTLGWDNVDKDESG
jgi:hypothetical protein